MAEGTGRRGFVSRIARAAGVAAAVLPLVEGGDAALAKGDETDLAIISASVMLEYHAIALYEHGLKEGLFPSGLRGYAMEFRGDHQGHRDTQIAIAEERGGGAPRRLEHYDFEQVGAGDAFIREALKVEVAAQRAYTGLISQIRDGDYLLSAAFILVDEVRHMTVWQRVLGIRIY